MRTGLRLLAPLALAACSPPSSSAKVNATLEEAIVIAAAADDEYGDDGPNWGIVVTAPEAAAGEYLLFFSATRPTSAAALEGFDPSNCIAVTQRVGSDPCELPGLGRLDRRLVLEADGPLHLYGEGGGSTRQFITIVRRDADADAMPTPLSATVSLRINGGFCTGNPEPPALLVLSLVE